MIGFKKPVSLILPLIKPLRATTVFGFSNNRWKDKEQTEQKVYVSKQQKQAMKKLVDQFDLQSKDHQSNLQEFQRRLRDTMRRYRIQDETLVTRIVSLHRQTTLG